MNPLRRLGYATILAALLLAQPASALSHWAAIAERLQAASVMVEITRMEDGEEVHGSCTAFSINQRYDYYLTANHCAGDSLTVEGLPAEQVYLDEANDLMVIRVPGTDHKALRPGRKPAQGDQIGSFGYAWGIAPRMHVGVVAAIDLIVPTDELPGPWLSMDYPLIGGMSGGPTVDADGRVVGINQWVLTNVGMGFGRAIDVILESTGNYWQYHQ